MQVGLCAGFAWAGNPRYKADSQRSMKLETLMPLLRIPGITWISLQNGPAAKELSGLPGNVFVWDGASGDRDLAEAAALIATLDLVITTDTCIAHLAGAMGKPVWILLPHLSDWRWMQEIETLAVVSHRSALPPVCTGRLARRAKSSDQSVEWNSPGAVDAGAKEVSRRAFMAGTSGSRLIST